MNRARIRVGVRARRTQRGFGIASALLALVIGAVVTMGQIEGVRVERQTKSGALQGDLINLVREAYNAYAMEHYPALQSNLPVTKAGVTLAAGAAAGQSMAPRVQDLVAMGYLAAGTTDRAMLSDGGTYRGIFRREPAACVAAACNVPGTLYIDRPVLVRGTAEMNGLAVGSIIERVGGDALVALNTNPAIMVAMNGASVPNPVAGTPPGVVGARIGFGASGFGRFLVLNDPRDPNFQGGVSVRGSVTALGTVHGASGVSVGQGSTGCRLGEITSSGAFISRALDCVRRAWVDGANGEIGVADAAGNTRALIDADDGSLTLRNAAGTKAAGFSWAGNDSTVYADNLRNSAGSAGIRADGTVYGDLGVFDSVVINESATLGASCTTANAAVWGTVSSTPVLLKCEGGRWVAATGSPVADIGQACTVPNQHGVTSAGVGLVCQGGMWMRLTDRIGMWAVAQTYLVAHGTNVPKPACGSGGSARIYDIPQSIDASRLYVNFQASDYGAGWTTLITDNSGVGISGQAIAQTGCVY